MSRLIFNPFWSLQLAHMLHKDDRIQLWTLGCWLQWWVSKGIDRSEWFGFIHCLFGFILLCHLPAAGLLLHQVRCSATLSSVQCTDCSFHKMWLQLSLSASHQLYMHRKVADGAALSMLSEVGSLASTRLGSIILSTVCLVLISFLLKASTSLILSLLCCKCCARMTQDKWTLGCWLWWWVSKRIDRSEYSVRMLF